ncbi:MAG TPA: GFA family protein [Gammaproteobacteria bacterium]|nr:GFA family protein [Gammaproteobacteria bacterium]
MPKLKGECLCGAVKYAFDGVVGDILHCHCSECRKWHGSAFRSRTVVKKADFRWISGEHFVAHYEGLPTSIKTFCKICGSNLVSYFKDNEEMLGLPLGGVEGDLNKTPRCHIFVDSKAKWYEICDDLDQYPGYPDSFGSIHKQEN